MTNTCKPALTASVVLMMACTPVVSAQAKKATGSSKADAADKTKAAEKGDASGKPVQVGTFGEWGAYLVKGKSKTCYALAKPTDRKGEGKKEAAYIFIADRPAEKVHNEVSIIMGFPMKDSAAATAKVGTASFDLVAKGQDAWIKNPEDESKFVDALKHNAKLTIKAPPAKGPVTTDTYTLAGFKPALDHVSKDCK